MTCRFPSSVQPFNVTNHDNPRDVISVETSPRFQEFANGFGMTLAGYMQRNLVRMYCCALS